MNRALRAFTLLIILTASCRTIMADSGEQKLKWESIRDIANLEEINKIQAQLDGWSCFGFPLRTSIYKSQDTSDPQLIREFSRVCGGAKIAKIANIGKNQLIVLQFESTGTCGDFDDAFFMENDEGSVVTPINVHGQSSVCGTGILKTSLTDKGQLLKIEVEEQPMVERTLALLWNGSELIDVSKQSR
jgi:hypothetical protein